MATIASCIVHDMTDTQLKQLFFILASATSGICSVTMVGELIKSISKKTLLQSKLDDINFELRNGEEAKSKGMR